MNKMYIVVNQDLKMGKGLVSAQCCHAVFDYMDKHIKKMFRLHDIWSFRPCCESIIYI